MAVWSLFLQNDSEGPTFIFCTTYALQRFLTQADQFICGVAPSITARSFSSRPSDSTSRWTPCPPENYEAWLQVHLGCIRLSSLCPFKITAGPASTTAVICNRDAQLALSMFPRTAVTGAISC